MKNDLHAYHGSCHCRSLRFTYLTAKAPQAWSVRACQCSFCRAHGARTTSDGRGSVSFDIREPAHLNRYRFGLRVTDFFICRRCGVYLAAVMDDAYATLNVNTMAHDLPLPAADHAVYDAESLDERLQRRRERWTPVVFVRQQS